MIGFSIPLSVIFMDLRLGRREVSNHYYYILPTEVKIDSVESCKMSETLW